MKEGMQTNKLFVTSRWLFITKDSPINLDERVMVMELKQLVVKCKNSDGRYENSVQIIASFSITQLAYLIIKSNPDIFVKGIDSTTLDGLSLKSIQKISQDVLSDKIKSSPVRRVYILKPGKFVSRLLGVSNPREKIKKLWKLFWLLFLKKYF
jgi:retron-type reverse transcriptase